MMDNESASVDDTQCPNSVLELVTADERTWTAVPTHVNEEPHYHGRWISVETETLCELEEWR